MKIIFTVFLSLIFFSTLTFAEGGSDKKSFTSIYTDLDESKCKTIVLNEEEAYSEQLCAGVQEFALKVLDGDGRQSITIVAPELQEYPLDYWHIITSSFSTLGKKAEWRMQNIGNQQQIPIALIVRVNAEENGTRSYLAVAKITGDAVCVVDKIPPQALQNELARKSADNSAAKPCLSNL